MTQAVVLFPLPQFEYKAYAVGDVVDFTADDLAFLKQRRLVDDTASVVAAAIASGKVPKTHVNGVAPSLAPAMVDESTGQFTSPAAQEAVRGVVGANDWQSLGGLMDAGSWTRHGLQIRAGVGGVASASVYWGWVVKTDRVTNPLAPYYLFFSTDHDAGQGGIYMAHGPSRTGPWTYHGRVFFDASGGQQTETPSIIWSGPEAKYRMYYQNNAARYGAGDATAAIGQQSTLSATSTDLITWVKDPNFVLDVPSLTDTHGDGHTGYFLPFQTRHGLYAYGLYGGTSGMDFVLWRTARGSPDQWVTDGVSLGYSLHLTQGTPLNGRQTSWNSSFVVESGGVEYWIGRIDDAPAGVTPANGAIGIAPISADYRQLMARPQIIWTPQESWENANLRTVTPYVENGVLTVFYTIDNDKMGAISHVL